MRSFPTVTAVLFAMSMSLLGAAPAGVRYFDAHNHLSGILPYYAYADLPAFIESLSNPRKQVSVEDRRRRLQEPASSANGDPDGRKAHYHPDNSVFRRPRGSSGNGYPNSRRSRACGVGTHTYPDDSKRVEVERAQLVAGRSIRRRMDSRLSAQNRYLRVHAGQPVPVERRRVDPASLPMAGAGNSPRRATSATSEARL